MRFLKSISSTVFAIFLALLSCSAFADYQLNMTPGVTPISHAVYNLHMISFWICVGIGIVVFGVMFYSLFMHRKSRGAKAAHFHEHTTIEIIWGVIPLIILIIIAIPATKVLILMDDNSDADINIKVTGYQWKWKYKYLDDGIEFFSNLSTPQDQIKGKAPKDQHYLLEVDNPLVIPINKKVRFLVTANDVIHSWWVPAFGFKRDAIPGFIHESWAIVEKPGIYRGQCAELCGVGHGFMPIVVEAKTEEDYQKWIGEHKAKLAQAAQAEEKTWTKEELMETGEKSYLTYCSVCHQPNGEGMGAFPALKGSKIALGPIEKHEDIVLHGKAGTAMQAFGDQLSDSDIAAIITYERNAWGNNTGDLVQPADIKAAKGGGAAPAAAASAKPAAAAPAAAPKPAAQPAAKPDPNKEYSKEELMKSGEDVYLKVCAVCHQATGKGMPPTFPALTDSAIVKGPASAHIDIVLHGKQGTAMQAFQSQLNDLEIASVITYERNAWNGGKGTVVQPKDIVKAKNEKQGD